MDTLPDFPARTGQPRGREPLYHRGRLPAPGAGVDGEEPHGDGQQPRVLDGRYTGPVRYAAAGPPAPAGSQPARPRPPRRPGRGAPPPRPPPPPARGGGRPAPGPGAPRPSSPRS